MVLRACLALLLTLAGSIVHAEPIFPDELYMAYVQAGRGIAGGKKREDALATLKVAIEKHRDSRFLDLAQRLARDIATSVGQAERRARVGHTLDNAPGEFLSETTMPLYLLAHPGNWERALPRFIEATPRDPAVLLLKQDRGCIESLIPQLADQSPTRSFQDLGFDGMAKIPRVCDLSLGLIERVSGCKFHFNASSGELFHELYAEAREKKIKHIAAWWEENKDKTFAEGIRAQLPNGDFYAQITMAENLVRAAGDQAPENRDFGLETLRRLAGSRADYTGAAAARALEKFGDLSPVERYCDDLRKSLTNPGRYYSNTIEALFYIADHAKRKEWELLRDVAVRDLERERDSRSGEHAYVLGSLLNSPQAAKSPFAIPLLGLGLSRTKHTGSRYINEKVGAQSYSAADQAAEYLQKLTGEDFGYCREGTAKERADAIDRAQKWWDDVGKSKYTFDYIEENLADGVKKPGP